MFGVVQGEAAAVAHHHLVAIGRNRVSTAQTFDEHGHFPLLAIEVDELGGTIVLAAVEGIAAADEEEPIDRRAEIAEVVGVDGHAGHAALDAFEVNGDRLHTGVFGLVFLVVGGFVVLLIRLGRLDFVTLGREGVRNVLAQREHEQPGVARRNDVPFEARDLRGVAAIGKEEEVLAVAIPHRFELVELEGRDPLEAAVFEREDPDRAQLGRLPEAHRDPTRIRRPGEIADSPAGVLRHLAEILRRDLEDEEATGDVGHRDLLTVRSPLDVSDAAGEGGGGFRR